MEKSYQRSINVRTLPFEIDSLAWELLAPDIRSLMWEGWSLKLQLDELVYRRDHVKTLDETSSAGPIKPLKPLTPEQSRKRGLKLNAHNARLIAAKRASSCKLAQLQQKLADE